MRAVDEEYVEAVLDLVERIPPGRCMTYGAVADAVGRHGPRLVGRVLSAYGGGVPWWRVVTASGRVPPGLEVEASAHLGAEGTPRRGDRVDVAAAAWEPEG
jgi:methylated-DNA-protein-cysteine methyltransferase-like protein